MNHDATHCSDYDEKSCPESCYRARLTQELREIVYPLPVSWESFAGTIICDRKEDVTK